MAKGGKRRKVVVKRRKKRGSEKERERESNDQLFTVRQENLTTNYNGISAYLAALRIFP